MPFQEGTNRTPHFFYFYLYTLFYPDPREELAAALDDRNHTIGLPLNRNRRVLFTLRITGMSGHVDGDTAAVSTHKLAVIEQRRHIGDQLFASRSPRSGGNGNTGHGRQNPHGGRGCGSNGRIGQ